MGRRSTVPVRDAAQEGKRRSGRLSLAVAAALLVCASAPAALSDSGAGAKSAATLKAEAQQILAQINANGQRISTLDEEINGAQYRLSQLHDEIARTSQQIASAQHTIDSLHSAVVARAAALYQGAGGAADIAAQSAASVQQQGAMNVYSEAAAAQDQQRIDAYRNARDERTRAKAQLSAVEASERNQLASLEASRRQIATLNTREQRLYDQTNAALKAEIQTEQLQALLAQRAASAAAAARARAAAARQVSSGGGGGGGGSAGPIVGPAPAPNPGAQAAVNFAINQIGLPYVFAAAGPSSYDCSGLTMRAWQQAGVYMPHSADAQYRMFPHVPIGDAQPGDLAFYGTPAYVHHVGIIIGNGLMVEAPYTGADVREAGYMRPDLVAIGRP